MALNFDVKPDGQSSDEILITRITQGDAAALEALYDRYAPLVLGVALKILSDRAAAETVLQETFWRLWKDPASQPAGSFPGWLFRTARSLALDTARPNLIREV